jgi:predicted peptidase
MDSAFHYLDAPDFNDHTIFIWPEHITAIGEVFEDGLVLSAIRIEFSGKIGAGLLLPAFFQVPGRKVIHTYVNATGKRRESAGKGHCLFLELLVNESPDSNEFKEVTGNYRYSAGSMGWAVELPIVTAVRQIETVFNFDDRRIVPFNKVNDDQYIEVVDDFHKGTYVDPETGIGINYNLYVPTGYEEKVSDAHKLPLVFFMHGAGESGYDNRAPVIAYRQVQEYLKEKVREENPCFALIPQCPMTLERSGELFNGTVPIDEFGWYTYVKDEKTGIRYTYPSASLHAAINMISQDIVSVYDIDVTRIYAVGHSMGGGGAVCALLDRPGLFTAALSFASAAVFSREMLERLRNKPIFFTMAEDESYNCIRENMPIMMDQLQEMGIKVYRCTGCGAWDATLRGDAAEKQAGDTIAMARAAGAIMIYIEYIKGSTVPDGHLTHRASFENASIRRWLFSQRNPRKKENQIK